MSQHADLLARYKHLRQVGLELNTRLGETVSRGVPDEGGKKLGILKRGVLTLDTEDEIAVLMDFCLHDVRRRGANAIDRYLAKSSPDADPDELVLLGALRQARFSLLAVEAAEPGVGVRARDLFRDQPLFLVDVGLSRTAAAGLVLAARVMAPDGIGMTTGAALPVGVLSPAERDRLLGRLRDRFPGLDFAGLSPKEAGEVAASVLRTCLRNGAAEWIAYVEPGHVGRGSKAPPRDWPPSSAWPASE